MASPFGRFTEHFVPCVPQVIPTAEIVPPSGLVIVSNGSDVENPTPHRIAAIMTPAINSTRTTSAAHR